MKRKYNPNIIITIAILLISATFIPIINAETISTSSKNITDEHTTNPNIIPINNVDTPDTVENIVVKKSVAKRRPSTFTFNEDDLGPDCIGIHIYTKCGDIEKTTPVTFKKIFELILTDGLPINVDDNEDTGPDGNDIKTKFYFYPCLLGGGIGIAIKLKVERLGDEILNKNFEVYLKWFFPVFLDFGQSLHYIRIGYTSSDKLPKSVTTTFSFSPHIFTYMKPVFKMGIDPEYDGDPAHNLTLVASYAKIKANDGEELLHKEFSVEFDPAVDSTVTISSGKSGDTWENEFDWSSTKDSIVTFSYDVKEIGGQKRSIKLKIDKLPRRLSYNLRLTPLSGNGGIFEYKGDDEADILFSVETDGLGQCRCVYLKGLPKEISVSWRPDFRDGEFHATTTPSIEEFGIYDELANPNIALILNDLPESLNASWNLSPSGELHLDSEGEGFRIMFYRLFENNENSWIKRISLSIENALPSNIDAFWDFSSVGSGDFTITSDVSHANTTIMLSIFSDNWTMSELFQLKADYLSISWKLGLSGYLTIDTDNRSVAQSTFSILKNTTNGKYYGINITFDSWKTDDFCINWSLSFDPFDIDWSGYIELVDNIIISLMHNGNWYEIEASCNLSESSGYFYIRSNADADVTLRSLSGSNWNWSIDEIISLKAGHYSNISWNMRSLRFMNFSGSLGIDTGNQEVFLLKTLIKFPITIGNNNYTFIANITAHSPRAENFSIDWIISLEDLEFEIETSGSLNSGYITFDVWRSIAEKWWRIWP